MFPKAKREGGNLPFSFKPNQRPSTPILYVRYIEISIVLIQMNKMGYYSLNSYLSRCRYTVFYLNKEYNLKLVIKFTDTEYI